LGGSVYSNAELGFEDLLNFRASHFVTGNFVLTGAGVDHDVLASLASCYLSKAVEAPSVPYPASAFKGGEARLKASGLSAHVALAFKSGALGKNDAADVLAAVLNARLSSAHGGSCGAFSTAYSDVGLTGVYGMGDVTTIVDTLASTMKTIAAGLTAKEFEVAKTKVALSRALELESNEGTTGLTIAKAVAARLDPTAYALAPKKLTDQEVVECAKEALKAGLAYAALGPVGQLPRYDAVCKMLSV
jgi:predicted Zn-dependent peptidase